MEDFYLEEPTLERKDEAYSYLDEFIKYKSNINGMGGLQRYPYDYNGWLKKLEDDKIRIPNEEKVPARTYFLVRCEDNKIIGMINIRLCLNKRLEKFGGHIGYSIRPTERGKGYNNINLYLGLLKCKEFGINEVLMDANIHNLASWKTMEKLGGVRISEEYNDYEEDVLVRYVINVDEGIKKKEKILK